MSDREYISGHEDGEVAASEIILEILEFMQFSRLDEVKGYIEKINDDNYYHRCAGCEKIMDEVWLTYCEKCDDGRN